MPEWILPENLSLPSLVTHNTSLYVTSVYKQVLTHPSVYIRCCIQYCRTTYVNEYAIQPNGCAIAYTPYWPFPVLAYSHANSWHTGYILYVLYMYTLCHACIYTVRTCVHTYIVECCLLLYNLWMCFVWRLVVFVEEGREVVYTLSCWVWWLRAWDNVTFIGNGRIHR